MMGTQDVLQSRTHCEASKERFVLIDIVHNLTVAVVRDTQDVLQSGTHREPSKERFVLIDNIHKLKVGVVRDTQDCSAKWDSL